MQSAAMKHKLNNNVLRSSAPAELATYFRTTLKESNTKAITGQLLTAIAVESVPPKSVFSVWLSACQDPACLVDAMRQEHSLAVRKLAIRHFGKWLRGPGFAVVWATMGGTQGVLDFLATISVNEVRLFCRVIGRTSTSGIVREQRQSVVTELLTALACDHFPETKLGTTDRRPLLRQYVRMLPACTADFVDIWMSTDGLPAPNAKKLMEAHPDLLRNRRLWESGSEQDTERHLDKYTPLLTDLPPLPSAEPGVSESMAFSTRLLEELKAGRAQTEPDQFQDHLGVPLMRRLWRRKCSNEKRLVVLQSLKDYLQSQPKAAKRLRLEQDSILAYLIRLWSRHPYHFEGSLVDIARLVPEDELKSLRPITSLVELVKPTLRLPLLRLLLQHLRNFRFDLDDDSQLKDQLKSQSTYWPSRLFLVLPKQDALPLVRRFTTLRPEGDFLDNWIIGDHQSIFQYKSLGASTVLSLYLSRGEDSCHEQAQATLETWQERSSTSREQQHGRAYWAQFAVYCAIASGSLEMYRNTLLWTRRFNRDALTVKDLYGEWTVQTFEGMDLLCGIPSRPNISTTTADEIQRSIGKGNEICMLLLETATMCVREPSFYAPDWKAVLGLFGEITKLRLARVNGLQEALGLSDEEIYKTVWQSTLETCMAIERLGHQDGHEGLAFNTVGGPLQVSGTLEPSSISPATMKFIDQLAMQRDNLWQSIRKAANPDVVTLQAPWPKGLPLHFLLAVDLDETCNGYSLPYLIWRAERIVFAEPATFLASFDDLSDAVGIFVEDWSAALKLYVNAAPEGPQRMQRTKQAWEYALGEPTGCRMSTVEARNFWGEVFENVDIDTSFVDDPEPCQTIPQNNEPTQPTEWNPDTGTEQSNARARQLSTALGRMIGPKTVTPDADIHTPLSAWEEASLPRREFWDDASKVRSSPGSREAYIAAALLLLNSKCCPSHRLLASPFPKDGDVRFPSLYLDEDFLERKDSETSAAIKCLQYHQEEVPPTLLLELGQAMFTDSKQQATAGLKHDTFAVLKLLAESDKPSLVLDLVFELVLDQPENSSWHRHLFNRALFNRLQIGQARQFMTKLSSEVSRRLEEQVGSVAKVQSESSVADKQPVIKVSTIKMLAQTMGNADFIDQHYAISVLVPMLAHAKHRDIRIAVIESLLRILGDSRDEQVQSSIFAALEEHAVPLAADLNETNRTDWDEAEAIGRLPEVYNATSPENGPTLQVLLDFCRTTTYTTSETRKQELFKRILLPTLRLSAVNNQRWMKLFMLKQGVDMPVTQLPAVPVKMNALSAVLPCVECLPASLLTVYVDYMITVMAPPLPLRKLKATVLEDTTSGNSNACGHFLSLWGAPGDDAFWHGVRHITAFLKQDLDAQHDGGVTYDQVQAHVLEIADLLIMQSDGTLAKWESFQQELEPHIRAKEDIQRRWYKCCRPIVEKLVQNIDGLRTEQWQLSPDRNPSVLPSTYQMRLWLMTYPTMPWLPGHVEKRKVFISEVFSFIDEMASDHKPYAERLQELKHAVVKIFESDYADVALVLGSLTDIDGPSHDLADYLRIDLAEALIQGKMQPKDDEVLVKLRAMLLHWKASVDEDVRMRGIRALKRIEDEKPSSHGP